jgi:hypothetical protein
MPLCQFKILNNLKIIQISIIINKIFLLKEEVALKIHIIHNMSLINRLK